MIMRLTSWLGCGLGVAGLALAAAPARAAGNCKVALIADLPVTMEGLNPSVNATVNGKDTSFWLDSGGFFSLMSAAKAQELKLKLQAAPYGLSLVGVGGGASVDLATIRSLKLSGHDLPNLQFLVGGTDTGKGLIGRNILGIGDTEFDLANGSVKLMDVHGCNTVAMAYWTDGKPWFTVPLITSLPNDHSFRLPVAINGAKIEAELDSGASTSLLSRRAAERAGIDLNAPGLVPVAGIGGIGRRFASGWIVPVAKVAIGDEEILNTRIRVIDGPIVAGDQGPDMLLGADYILAHHIYIARGQNRIYFTYSGGKPFVTPLAAGAAMASRSPAAPAAIPADRKRVEAVAGNAAEPKTAADYARRGNARLAARNDAGAIADLGEAIRLSPTVAAYYSARARAYGQKGDGRASRADFDKALQLDPNDAELLPMRSAERLREQDRAGALADAEAATSATAPTSLDRLDIAIQFERLGQPARAIALLGPVIAAHPVDSRLPRMLNARCWERGLANIDLDKALDDCNRAIKRGPPADQAKYLDSRGLVHFRKGNMALAIADYDAALKADPQLAWSLYLRGLAKIALGQTDAGKADQSAARAIEPGIADRVAGYGIGK